MLKAFFMKVYFSKAKCKNRIRLKKIKKVLEKIIP